MSKHDLIFYSKRSTPKVVAQGASPGKVPEGYGKVTKRRAATEKEERVIARGKWVRVDEKARTPSDSDYKVTKYRPKLGAKRKASQ
jgi:hypothetical protein